MAINRDFWDAWSYVHVLAGIMWAVTIWTFIDHPIEVKFQFFLISVVIFEFIEGLLSYYWIKPNSENEINILGDIFADFIGLGVFLFLAWIFELLPLDSPFPPI